jgi:hypothetical protein
MRFYKNRGSVYKPISKVERGNSEEDERMKKNKFFVGTLLLLLLLATTSSVSASIVSWSCADDGDSAIVMHSGSWNSQENELLISCTQFWSPGHVAGDFKTDTELDPTVWFLEDVENDTTFAWKDYHIDFGMNKSFTILSATPPSGWTFNITAPVGGQPLPGNPPGPGTGWVGKVDYYQGAGSPIAIGDDGTFGLKVSFTGSVNFYTAQTPTPEPATIGLLGLGALVLLRKCR